MSAFSFSKYLIWTNYRSLSLNHDQVDYGQRNKISERTPLRGGFPCSLLGGQAATVIVRQDAPPAPLHYWQINKYTINNNKIQIHKYKHTRQDCHHQTILLLFHSTIAIYSNILAYAPKLAHLQPHSEICILVIRWHTSDSNHVKIESPCPWFLHVMADVCIVLFERYFGEKVAKYVDLVGSDSILIARWFDDGLVSTISSPRCVCSFQLEPLQCIGAE